jgi:uncharacterized SAM-binding protein YcdF (DUF218 family)
MTRRTRAWTAVLLLPVVALAYLGLTLIQVATTGRSYATAPGEVIVVLGAAQYDGRPSPQLQGRLDEVVRIWETGQIPWVMVTGGRQAGDRFSEADASVRYLTAAGIPEAAILVEDQGATTYASLLAASRILRGKGLTEVVVVTDPFHSLRSQLIAREVGLSAVVAPTKTSVVAGSRNLRLHLREALGVAVGRLVGFERLTDWVG